MSILHLLLMTLNDANSHPSNPESHNLQWIQIDDLVIDRLAHEMRVKGKPIKLTRKEFNLLWALGSDPECVFRREELLNMVWGSQITVEPRTVDAHIARLRRLFKKEKDISPSIETVWGIGYRLRKRFALPHDP